MQMALESVLHDGVKVEVIFGRVWFEFDFLRCLNVSVSPSQNRQGFFSQACFVSLCIIGKTRNLLGVNEVFSLT